MPGAHMKRGSLPHLSQLLTFYSLSFQSEEPPAKKRKILGAKSVSDTSIFETVVNNGNYESMSSKKVCFASLMSCHNMCADRC